MTVAKPIASLSSGLLARKGHAKPAMRSQGFHGNAPAGALDDLGWNDMGVEQSAEGAPAVAPVRQVPPAPQMPPVLRQREELAGEFAPAPPEKRRGISLATAQRIGRETRRRLGGAGKAAFTLRLDMDRHLRLRLASAIDGRSSQQLVTEALDRLLTEHPELTAMLDQLANARKD